MKHAYYILISLFLVSQPILSQTDYDEFVKQQQQEMTAQEQEQEKWKKDRDEEFNKFVKEREIYIQKLDSEFTAYIKEHWDSFDAFKANAPEKPKPNVQPKLDKIAAKSGNSIIVVSTSNKAIVSEIPMPVLSKEEPAKFPKNTAQFKFYGTPISIDYDKNFITYISSPVNEEIIGEKLTLFNNYFYGTLINDLLFYKNRMNLNDWGYYQLIKQFSEAAYSKSGNSSTFLTWYLLMKSNYKVKLGFADNNLVLLVPFQQEIFQRLYIVIDQIKYYVIEKTEAKNIATYRKDFPEARKICDLSVNLPMYLKPDIKVRKIPFGDDTLKIKYNANLVSFYKEYPLASLDVYFSAELSTATKESVIESFSKITKGKSEKDAISSVLKAIQDLPYKTDQDQFGDEKFMFTEEFFSYPACDCDDRAVTFSVILRELFKTPSVGLEYSDHVSCAVKFKDQVQGDFLNINNQQYLVCDPTYVNAPIGMAMPKYKDEKAKVIVPGLMAFNAKSIETIWNDLMARGANHGSNKNDIVFDQNNNAYITGYFTDTLKYNGYIKSVNKSNDLFVAKYGTDNKPIWIKTFGGPGNDLGFNIKLDDKNDIFISGLTDKEITFGTDKISLDQNNDIFIAKLSNSGTPLWIEGSGLQNSKQTDNNVFTTCVSSSGIFKNLRLFPENEGYRDFGLNIDPTGDVFFTGSLLANGGLKSKDIKFNDYASFDIIDLYKQEASKLSSQQYHQSLIGILSVMNLINSTELTIPGNKVQEVLNKYNPSFKKTNSSVYENLGKVDFIKNNKGIIVIRSKTGEPVNFSYMKVGNEAKIRIFSYNTGNTQVEVLNGISVGKSIIWYNLNFIKMMKQSGDLIFDYDNNHSQKKIEVKELLN
jgi:hypothetical protein